MGPKVNLNQGYCERNDFGRNDFGSGFGKWYACSSLKASKCIGSVVVFIGLIVDIGGIVLKGYL